MDKVELKKYLPNAYELKEPITDNGKEYKYIIEVQEEQDSLSGVLDKMNERYEEALNDQFIQKCSLKAIEYYEDTFHIVGDPTTETLEFRRERVLSRMKSLRPPYTYWYLRQMLDRFFGVGKYNLEITPNEYLIELESSAEDSQWYHEIQVSMTLIKPCNMIFKNVPRISNTLLTNETVTSKASVRNYRLDGTWLLGLRPFVSIGDEETRKMANVKSVRPYFIDTNLEYWRGLFTKSVINNQITVTNLNISISDPKLIIEYEVDRETVNTITNIKLVNGEDNTLFESNVFIPIDDYAIIKHIIKLEEGVNA